MSMKGVKATTITATKNNTTDNNEKWHEHSNHISRNGKKSALAIMNAKTSKRTSDKRGVDEWGPRRD